MNAVNSRFAVLRGWITEPMVVAFLIFGSVPWWIEAVGLYPYLGVEILVFCIFALGFNVLFGTTGLPSFGHGTYLGIGAYAMGLTQFHLVPNLWLGLLAATLTAAAFGAVVALFIAHRRGIYFALMTIAFGQLFFFIASKWASVTKGEDGLLNIKRLPADFGFVSFPLRGNAALYWFTFACFVAVVLLLWRLVNSPFGRVLQGIRENPFRAEALGYRTIVYRSIVNCLAAAMATLAGVLSALWLRYTGPAVTLSFDIMLDILLMVVIGGMGTLYGAVIGATIFILAENYLQAFMGAVSKSMAALPVLPQLFHPDRWLLWLGVLFILSVYFFPSGIAGKLAARK